MNLPHISSSHCNSFVQKSYQFCYRFDTHTLFLFDIYGDTLLFTHPGLIFEKLEIGVCADPTKDLYNITSCNSCMNA